LTKAGVLGRSPAEERDNGPVREQPRCPLICPFRQDLVGAAAAAKHWRRCSIHLGNIPLGAHSYNVNLIVAVSPGGAQGNKYLPACTSNIFNNVHWICASVQD